ncbi:MAG: TlpA family protein disulfide reductase [Myxococcaceae bacterium]
MRAIKLLPFVAVLALGLACTPPPPVVDPPPDQYAPEFLGGGQLGPDGGFAYPGPYGVGTGSVIPNFQFMGFPRASTDHTALQVMQLADFYNPEGNAVYPAGSPYGAGIEKPRALLVDRSAVWCSPCNYEAKEVLPVERLKYAPLGGEFLVAIDDGPTPGDPAIQADLNGWVTRYHIDYPTVLNPNQVLSAIVGVDAYPGHIIVRTKDMKIVTWISGLPDPAFWKLFDDTLAGKPVLAGD